MTSTSSHNMTSAPSHNMTSTPSHNMTSTQSHNMTSTPSHNMTSAPSHNMTSTPSHNMTSTPSHNMTSAPSHNMRSTSSHNMTSTPSHNMTSTPSHNMTSTPSHNMTSAPSHNMTSTPSNNMTSAPSHNMTSTSSHNMTSAPSHNMTSTPSHNMTSTPSNNMISTQSFVQCVSAHVKFIYLSFPLTLTDALLCHADPWLSAWLSWCLHSYHFFWSAKGGFSGIVIGLTVSTWLTIGSYIYGAKAPKLPLGSTTGCARINISSVLSASGNISTADSTMLWTMVTTSTTGASIQSATINAMANRIDKRFSMYDLSYVWSPFIGTLVTVFSGLCCSLVYRMIFKPEVSTDPSLLFPWAKSIWRIKDVPIAAPMEPSHANGNGHLRLTDLQKKSPSDL
ncbi:hypothetical protein Btru_071406 [Bulinus truncatus]|nr:hypothetical protein Btru_071406 [Bulinus truncatus]